MPLHVDQRNERFREALALLIAEIVEFPQGVFVTVLGAKLSPSQQDAVVTLSVFPADRQSEALRLLDFYSHDIKDGLARALRLRHIPRFVWKFDRTGVEVETIDQAIEELKRKGEL